MERSENSPEGTGAVLSYLRMTIGAEHSAVFEADLARMVTLAREQPGFRWVETYQRQGEPCTYLVLSEWESLDAMRGWLRHPDHLEVLRNYKRRYQGGKVERRRYALLPPK